MYVIELDTIDMYLTGLVTVQCAQCIVCTVWSTLD